MSITPCMSPPCSQVTACQHHRHKYQGTKRANKKYNQNLKYALTSNAKTTQKTDAPWARQVTETNWTLNHHVIWTPPALLSLYYQPCVRKTSFFASFPPQPVKNRTPYFLGNNREEMLFHSCSSLWTKFYCVVDLGDYLFKTSVVLLSVSDVCLL